MPQASLKGLLPPFLRGLGPLTTVVCKKLITTVEAKYKAQGTPKEQASLFPCLLFVLRRKFPDCNTLATSWRKE